MKSIIQVRGLSKRYRIGAQRARYGSLRESLTTWARQPFHAVGKKRGLRQPTIWALKDVTFDVMPGEVLGVIGRNGAGKSTLLRVLSRITEPTEGEVDLFGRVGSLLEVGTGFHPELTGRENIFLNGAILGMTRAEIGRKFDEIVAFAEIEQFLDTAVKHYSSGMYVRLAFSVAAHLEPEILLVDEVLAVGDAGFQKKCLGKMGDVARDGRTVFFVSHNMAAIRTLCSRAILVEVGRLTHDGEADGVVDAYLDSGARSTSDRHWEGPQSAPGNESVRLKSALVRIEDGSLQAGIASDSAFDIVLEYWNLVPFAQLGSTVVLYDREGTCVLSSISNHESTWHGKPKPGGLFRSVCRIPAGLLNEGRFSVTIMFFGAAYSSVWKMDNVIQFEILDSGGVRGDYFGGWSGVVRPKLDWRTEYLGPDADASA